MDKVTSKLVDIVIPVHNRLELTKQTIESLLKNTPPDLYQLYIIDDLSTDGTREYLMDHANVMPIFFNNENIGPGASRNKVCDFITQRRYRSKYLYHSDNDVYFTPGWLETLIEFYGPLFSFASIAVLGGSCHPYLQDKTSHPIYNQKAELTRFKIGTKDAISGYSQFMDWKVWDQFGPFDETMRGAEKKIMGSEDWAFCQKIIAAGYSVGSLTPEVVVPCGKTNTYGEPATGSETFKQVEGVKVI